MKRYSVVTYIFGDYEKLREIQGTLDSDAEYICITDNPGLKSDTWQVVQFVSSKDNLSALDKLPEVRHNNIFKYLHSDILVRVDGSIQILDPLRIRCLVDYFVNNDYNISTICHPYRNSVYDELMAWKDIRNLGKDDFFSQTKFFYDTGWDYSRKGLFQVNFLIAQKSDRLQEFDSLMLDTLYKYGISGHYLRPCQTVFTVLYETRFPDLKMLPLSEEILHNNAMCWCMHNTDEWISYEPWNKVTAYLHDRPTALISI